MAVDLESAPVNGREHGNDSPPGPADPHQDPGMHVRKRNGRLEPVDVNKIVRAVQRSSGGLPDVDIMRIAVKTIGGLFDGATTRELDQLSIQTAASLIAEEPEYSQLAARLLDCYIDKEVMNQDIHSFSQAISAGHRLGLIAADTAGTPRSDNRSETGPLPWRSLRRRAGAKAK
jgi:ribonucleoside-diphosphate reductase alpha chain